MKKFDKWYDVDVAAKLEGVTPCAIHKRIRTGFYNENAVRKLSRKTGGFYYQIHSSVVSGQLPDHSEQSPATGSERKKRKDHGTSKIPAQIIFSAAATITMARSSSPNLLKKGFGFKEGYSYFLELCRQKKIEPVRYRRFIQLVSPFVDRELQKYNNKGQIRFKNDHEMKLLHDYSVYEPMQLIQNDHTQLDVVCIHNKKILRPWAAFHNSVGDRVLSYPTIVERPDSYSLADNLSNFILRYGLSTKPVIYKSDNGKAQKSRLITRNDIKEIELKPFKLEDAHLNVMKLMGVGLSHQKGLIQNTGMIEHHSGAREPWTKVIERQFGIGGTMDYFKDRPEYTGRKYEEKPERLAREIKRGNIWQSEEMVDFVMNKVDEYNNREHQGIKKECKGKFAVPHIYNLDIDHFQTSHKVLKSFIGFIPQNMSEVIRLFNDPGWSKKELKTDIYSPMWRRKIYQLCGWISRALPPRETMAMLSMKTEERVVHNYGILINNNAYINLVLQPYITKKVIIRYSPDSIIRIREQSGKEVLFIEEIAVFEKETEKFICIAEPHPRTVTGIHAEGYARTFIKARGEKRKEMSAAKKITTQIAQAKETESVKGMNLIQLNSFRDIAAKKLSVAKEEKKQTLKNKKAEQTALEKEWSEIYGVTIKIDEGA